MGAKHSRKRGAAMADKKFIDDMIKAHNVYRKRHQVGSLSHAKDLSTQAQSWAEHLALTNSFQHSSATLKGERIGENIAMKWSSQPDAYTGQEATDQWYSEIKMHTFGGEPRTTGTGHFTQVVWKGSKEIGVGRAVSKDGKVIVVANYRPAGNLVGTYAANVLPPKDGKIVLPPEPSAAKSKSKGKSKEKSKEKAKAKTKAKPKAEKNRPAASKPATKTTTAHFTVTSGDGAKGEPGRRTLFSSGGPSGTSTSKTESKSVRTYTVTEGVGSNKVTKTVTEETIIKANGEKIVNRKETTTSGGATQSQPSQFGAHFERLALKDRHEAAAAAAKPEAKKKSRPFWKRDKSSSSDSSSDREKGKSRSAGKAGRPQKMGDYIQDCLKAHNEKRAKHGVPALKLANDLNKHAQEWAEHLASRDAFEHSKCMVGGGRVGENIACSWSSAGADYTGGQAVEQWYDEIKKHNFKSDGSMGSGHFTQVVWKGSQELGCGKAKNGNGKCIVVCNYRPAGNMLGTYKDNVFPPK